MKTHMKLFLTFFIVLICGELKPDVTVSNITPYWLRVNLWVDSNQYQCSDYPSPAFGGTPGTLGLCQHDIKPGDHTIFKGASNANGVWGVYDNNSGFSNKGNLWYSGNVDFTFTGSKHNTWVIYYSPLDGTFRTDAYN